MIAMGNKEYGEFTVRFWADPDLFSKEYGTDGADALNCARNDFEGQATMTDYGENGVAEWRGAQIVKPATYDRDRLLEAYESWHALRTVIGHREEICLDTDPVDSDDWYNSDRDGVELAHDLAALLKPQNACGCKDVNVEQVEHDGVFTYTVQCENCPNVWTVRNDEIVKVRTWADGHGNWHASVSEVGVGHAVSCAADALAAITRELVERGVELDAIHARMSLVLVARDSQHGRLETEFKESWVPVD